MVEGDEGRSYRKVSNAAKRDNKSVLNLTVGKLSVTYARVFRQATWIRIKSSTD